MNNFADFGDSNFGLSCALITHDYGQVKVMVSLQFLVGGTLYGRPNDPVFADDASAVLLGLLAVGVRRIIPDLNEDKVQAIWGDIHQAIYGPDDPSETKEQIQGDNAKYHPFLLAPNGLENFDHCELMVISGLSSQYVCAAQTRPSSAATVNPDRVTCVELGHVEAVLANAVAWLCQVRQGR